MLDRTLQTLQALAHVLKIFPEAAAQTINRYKVIFYFLRVDENPAIQQAALAVIHLVVSNKVCDSAAWTAVGAQEGGTAANALACLRRRRVVVVAGGGGKPTRTASPTLPRRA